MVKRCVLPFLLFALLVPSVAPQRASADAVSALFASPAQARVGDTIWLSGSGLAPSTRYFLFVACPTWFDPSVLPSDNYRHIDISQGPKTDANGQFVDYRLHVFALNHLQSSICTVYTSVGGLIGFGPDIPAQYSVVPQSQRLSRCSVQICGSVTMSTKTARSGQYEMFEINSGHWGGAHSDVTITFNLKGEKPIHWSGSTDWEGTKRLWVRIPTQAAHIVTASISASFHLGRATGKAQPLAFTVVR